MTKGIQNRIIRLITELNECLVVVEGKRDVEALDEIGVRNSVITYEQLRREEIPSCDCAVILTDYDRAGEIKRKLAESALLAKNIPINHNLRTTFRRVFGILTVEETPSVFHKLMESR